MAVCPQEGNLVLFVYSHQCPCIMPGCSRPLHQIVFAYNQRHLLRFYHLRPKLSPQDFRVFADLLVRDFGIYLRYLNALTALRPSILLTDSIVLHCSG